MSFIILFCFFRLNYARAQIVQSHKMDAIKKRHRREPELEHYRRPPPPYYSGWDAGYGRPAGRRGGDHHRGGGGGNGGRHHHRNNEGRN